MLSCFINLRKCSSIIRFLLSSCFDGWLFDFAGDTYNWLEEDGYSAETKEYTRKLKELKRSARAIYRRVDESIRRPKYIEALRQSLNISNDFLVKMKNISSELQVVTDVEITTLEILVEETMVGYPKYPGFRVN